MSAAIARKENSPAFQRWVTGFIDERVPSGTKESLPEKRAERLPFMLLNLSGR
jgi:hypothetical protein